MCYMDSINQSSTPYPLRFTTRTIKLGMQMDEVIKIKGPPNRTSQTWTVEQGYIYWLYYDNGMLPTYTFINGSLTQFNGGW